MSDAAFTHGSTMGHVARMTLAGAVGLFAIFIVDAANLFYISMLGAKELAAAIGFAGSLQFFLVSLAIGLSIGVSAIVSRAIGEDDMVKARRLAASSLIIVAGAISLVSLLTWIWREDALALLGAEGDTLAIASRFLGISLPSLPLLGIGMATSSLLRSAGDARRSMYVTLAGGAVSAVMDPALIFGLSMGVDGAAVATILARLVMAVVGLAAVIKAHDMVARPRVGAILRDSTPLFAIAGPAIGTQLSTPFGNAYLTTVFAEFGDAAVAGWAVVGRLIPVAFGAIFALSGSVGPIFGQNLGAKRFDRVADTYRDALIFCTLYVLAAWFILWLATDLVIGAFNMSGQGEEVVRVFIQIGAGGFLFTGALFVSNAALNNLGRPLWSTGFNWVRNAVVIPVLAYLCAEPFGLTGAVYAQAGASVLVAIIAIMVGWRRIRTMTPAEPAAPAPAYAEAAAFSTGKASTALPLGRAPLAEERKPR